VSELYIDAIMHGATIKVIIVSVEIFTWVCRRYRNGRTEERRCIPTRLHNNTT